MKLTYKSLVAIMGLTSLMTVSCKKEKLSPIPQTSLSDAVAFSTPERIQQQVFGVYSGTKSGQLLGGRAVMYNDVRGEDWLNQTGNGVTAAGVWNFSVTSTDNQVENMWAAAYAAINRANVTIAGIDNNPSIISASVASRYKAEVRFLRALNYFYLVTLYGKKPYTADNGASDGVPLRLTPSTSAAGSDLIRAKVSEVYQQILTDLNFAESNLPLTYGSPVGDSNVVRAHRNAAIAFKTRVYLNMGDYANVVTEANKLVPATGPYVAPGGVPHKLASSFVSVFRTPYTDVESIFSFPMNNTNAPGTQNGLALYHNAEFSLNPSGILGDLSWKTTDSRRTLVTAATPPRYSKFNDDQNNYVPIIRYAEVMLNLAEALARQNAAIDVRAVALLNAVRQRSDATTTFIPTTKQELIDMILRERRIEFLGEGLRSMDIMRLGATFPAKGSVQAVPPSAQAYVWPIPASELLYNKLAVQN